ncbi:MAG: YqeG family HAD IIIA-type phosphatase [Gammaproteobacteria bacterium]
MIRFLYTLKQAWQHRQQLAHIRRQGQPSINDLSLEKLQQQGIKALLLDFDGVLANHGEMQPHQSILPFLKKACQYFGEHRLFILTNQPNKLRAHYFKTHFPTITFIQGFPKKPYPEAIHYVLSLTHLNPAACLLVDDRLLTGCLLACITGIHAQYITVPLINYKKHGILECFFQGLRLLERGLFG